jgi:hypothetical protein
MKKTIISLVVLLLAALSSAQNNIEDFLKDGIRVGAASASARNEKAKINKATRAYNDAQPTFRFDGATIEVRVEDETGLYDRMGTSSKWALRNSVAQKLTALGAKAMWDRREIERESDDRDFYEANRHVKKPDWLGSPTIGLANYQLDLAFFSAEKSEDFEFWLGRFWRGIDFSFGKDTVYVGVIARLTDRRSGESQIVYKVINSASNVDNVAGNVFGGIFGTSAGGSYEADSWEALELRALEGAINQLGEVFKYKNAS